MNRVGPPFVSTVARLFALCAVFSLMSTTPGHALPQGEWVEIGPPIGILASGGSLIILADGAPLLFGLEAAGVQQYHPETGAWTARGSLQTRRPGATVTVLPFDVVLLAGGADSNGNSQNTAEVYDPTTGTSTLTGSMHFARTGHQATLLASGKVLVSGGTDANSQLVGSAEIFDPRTGTWSLTGALNQPRSGHAAVRLPAGRVLVVGGSGESGALASAEIYDPGIGTWTPTSAMDRPRGNLKAVALTDGRILVAGVSVQGFDSEIYDPVSNAWSSSLTIRDAPGRSLIVGLVELHGGVPLDVENRDAIFRHSIDRPARPTGSGLAARGISGYGLARDRRSVRH